MKALLCGKCADVQALQTEWRTCKCGNLSGHWVSPHLGTAEFRAQDRSAGFILGLNNQMLGPALRHELVDWEARRAIHDLATDAPNHVFDKSRAACWAVPVQVGTTNDCKWAPEPEPLEVGDRVRNRGGGEEGTVVEIGDRYHHNYLIGPVMVDHGARPAGGDYKPLPYRRDDLEKIDSEEDTDGRTDD